jgi:electron transfer flavoprotein beta subunit
MKILVAVKRVVDPYVKVRVKSDQTGVDTHQVKMSMNPFDEIAVEEAIRLKEKGIATEVVIVSIGDSTCQETIRTALALGADRGIHVVIPTATQASLTSLMAAKILQKIAVTEAETKPISLFLLGKQSIDGDNNQTGQMLAALLNIAQGTFISNLEMVNEQQIKVVREVDGGLETLLLKLPAVVTTDLRLNQPRYASLPNIMKAKQKPLLSLPFEELGLPLNNSVTVVKTEAPPVREGGEILGSVAELVDKLKNKEKVI